MMSSNQSTNSNVDDGIGIAMQSLAVSEDQDPAATIHEAAVTDPLPNMATLEDIPPDGGYGWVCTLCVFLINAHTWGVNSVCVGGYP